MARMKATSQEEQDLLADYEHYAFAKEYSKESPILGPLSVAAAAPIYQAAKAMGVTNSRSSPSMKQLGMAYAGVGQAIAENIKVPWQAMWNDFKPTPPERPEEAPQPQSDKPWLQAWGGAKKPSYEPPKTLTRYDEVVAKMIHAESLGKHTDDKGELTTSAKGAKGITQVMPKTGKDPGYGVEPLKDHSEAEYIRFGKDYLKAMLNEFDNDFEKAVAAYNAGPKSVKKAIEKGEENWINFLPKKSETLPYLDKILGTSYATKG